MLHSNYEVTLSTTTAGHHLQKPIKGHGLSKDGRPKKVLLPKGQKTLENLADKGIVVAQEVANELGNFDVQVFRLSAFSWLVENNHPLREFETPTFRTMIKMANPEAEAALWESHLSVLWFIMRFYEYLQPQVRDDLSQAASKIHISFDGWTTKGGKRSFFSIVAHYANASGLIIDLPIALPQLSGHHTGE
jgi:hypothetical protein